MFKTWAKLGYIKRDNKGLSFILYSFTQWILTSNLLLDCCSAAASKLTFPWTLLPLHTSENRSFPHFPLPDCLLSFPFLHQAISSPTFPINSSVKRDKLDPCHFHSPVKSFATSGLGATTTTLLRTNSSCEKQVLLEKSERPTKQKLWKNHWARKWILFNL